VGGFDKAVADAAVLGALADRKYVRPVGGNAIVDDDPAIDRNAGTRRQFGIGLDADGGDNGVGREHAAVFQLHAFNMAVANESGGGGIQQHLDASRLERALEQRGGGRIELTLHQAIHEMDERHRGAGLGKTVSRFNAEETAADHDGARAAARSTRDRRHVAHVAERHHPGQIGAGDG
jgi:hypothetical protein